MLLDEGYPQGVEEHAFADDGGVGDASGGDEFTEGERIELENGVDDGGYGERSGDGEKEPEVFLRGRVVPKDGIGARDDDDQNDRYDEKGCFGVVKMVSGEDEGGGADADIPHGVQNIEQESEAWFLVVFIDDFRRMP